MHRFYLPPEESRGETLLLSGDEAHHAHHVLRLEAGKKVEVLNGAGEIITCAVGASSRSSLELIVIGRQARAPLPCSVTLIQAIPKGKLFEDIVEKATELGVSCIVPLISDRVISRPEGEDATRKAAKWRRTSIEALKQSGSAWLPKISLPINLADYLSAGERVELPLLASLQPDAREMRELRQPISRGAPASTQDVFAVDRTGRRFFACGNRAHNQRGRRVTDLAGSLGSANRDCRHRQFGDPESRDSQRHLVSARAGMTNIPSALLSFRRRRPGAIRMSRQGRRARIADVKASWDQSIPRNFRPDRAPL